MTMTSADHHVPDPDPDEFVSRQWICEQVRVSDKQLGKMLQTGEIAVFRQHRGRQPALIQARAVYDYIDRERERADREAAQERSRAKGRGTRKKHQHRPNDEN